MKFTVYRLIQSFCYRGFLTYVGICVLLFSGTAFSQKAKELAKEAHEYALLADYQTAKMRYEEAISLAPAFSQYHYQKGLCEFELGEDSLAIISFTQAISILNNRADFYYFRGRSFAELKQYDEALADYTIAIQLDPFMIDYHLHKGKVNVALAQFDEGLVNFSDAIQIDSRIGDPFVDRALCYIQLEQVELACQDLQQAVKKRAFNAKYLWQKHCQ